MKITFCSLVSVTLLLTISLFQASLADEAPASDRTPQRVEWLQKGTAWEDPANWSTGKVPGIDDIACFLSPDGKVTHQPVLNTTVHVGGLFFQNGNRAQGAGIPGVKNLLWNRLPTWMIQGAGTLGIGKYGIAYDPMGGTALIYPNIELLEEQDWTLGPVKWTRIVADDWYDGLSLPNLDCYGNGSILVIQGKLSGAGGIHKKGGGRVYYCNGASPTFTGGTWVEFGPLEWRIPGITASGDYSFGTKPIVLNAGTFCFGAAKSDNQEEIPSLTNPILVMDRNGILEFSQEGKIPQVPHSRFSGDIDLHGQIKVEHSTSGGTESRALVDGTVSLDQAEPATLGLITGDFNSDVSNDLGRFEGKVIDGPGDAMNPLILRTYAGIAWMGNAASTYSGGTVVAYCGMGVDWQDYWRARIGVGPEAKLGTGDLTIEPGGCILLSSPGNLAENATVTIRSSPMAAGVLDVGYNGLPKLSKDSCGVIAIDPVEFDAISDLSTLGNGRMFLSSAFHGPVNWPTFTGNTLAPGAGNVYRLGGGYVPSQGGTAWQKLRIRNGVLVGNASLEVGMSGFRGFGSVRLDGANTFSGPITVRGGIYSIGHSTTVLEGRVQTSAQGSPFGSSTGAVALYDASLALYNDTGGATPVNKGVLTFNGHCFLTMTAAKGPASLTFADLKRKGSSLLDVNGGSASLQNQEKLLVRAWKQDRPLLPPYIRCLGAKGESEFGCYDATNGKGVGIFANYKTDLKTALAEDVVSTGEIALAGESCTVKALKVTGPITGFGTIAIRGGGLLLNAEVAPNIDFGGTEGVVWGHIMTKILGKISGSGGLTLYDTGLVNPANDFKGPIHVLGGVQAIFDKEDQGKITQGSLGDLSNEIVIDGGLLQQMDAPQAGNCLAASRTLYLGPNGGMIDGHESPTTIYGKITGPGYLSQPAWMSNTVIIDNPKNDYSGGTLVSRYAGGGNGYSMVVTPRGKLGTGPVLLRADDVELVLEGDNNIDAMARLTVSDYGIAAFRSAQPGIGSLEGSGFILLGSDKGPTALSVGGDGTDTTFYGKMRDFSPNLGSSLIKTGAGVFTLYGGHAYTGPTVVQQGTLNLKGGVAGDLTVETDGTLEGTGKIGGTLTLAEGSLAVVLTDTGLKARPLKVAGAVKLSGKIQVQPATNYTPMPGQKWTVLTSLGGISGQFDQVTAGYQAVISPDGKSLELQKM